MKWQTKAKIMRVCAYLPASEDIYRFIQKRFGRLKANPMSRIPAQIEMARWVLDMGKRVDGKTFFEVGTGHNPIVPVGFFLCGADKVVTVDLNRRLDVGILKQSLVWMVENRDDLFSYYDGLVEKVVFNERMVLIDRLKEMPEAFLSEANIIYIAPGDAGNTDLSNFSVDYHISTTVFEHIPRPDIIRILDEAKRILKRDGVAIHFIDLSDHFQHQDSSIIKINFLQFSEQEWMSIAGNEFAYCNRLRISDYASLFEELNFKIIRIESEVDGESLNSIKNDFIVNEVFKPYNLEELCTIRLRVMMIKREYNV